MKKDPSGSLRAGSGRSNTIPRWYARKRIETLLGLLERARDVCPEGVGEYHTSMVRAKMNRDPERSLRAGSGIRTREYQLGRLTPYHLAMPALRQKL
jgi:hypothetical protein